MSAWLVSPAHVDVIVTAAIDGRLAVIGMSPDPNEMGRALFTQNAASLAARYGGRDPSARQGFEDAAAYRHRTAYLPTDAALFKACRCYVYQACETEGYQKTPAILLAEAVAEMARRRLGWSPMPASFGAFEQWPHRAAYSDAGGWGVDESDVALTPGAAPA